MITLLSEFSLTAERLLLIFIRFGGYWGHTPEFPAVTLTDASLQQELAEFEASGRRDLILPATENPV